MKQTQLGIEAGSKSSWRPFLSHPQRMDEQVFLVLRFLLVLLLRSSFASYVVSGGVCGLRSVPHVIQIAKDACSSTQVHVPSYGKRSK